MSYRANWRRHMVATLTGNGFSDELARDFWPAGEDLFDPSVRIRWRWAKLVYVHCVSAIVQITVPLVLAGVAITVFKNGSLTWYLIVLGAATALGLLFALLLATWAYLTIIKQAHRKR